MPMDSPPAPGMMWIPGGSFLMGSDDHYPEEAPAHQVSVGGFWIDRHTVTNAEFARFVHKTGHVTVAEQAPDPAPSAPPGRTRSGEDPGRVAGEEIVVLRSPQEANDPKLDDEVVDEFLSSRFR